MPHSPSIPHAQPEARLMRLATTASLIAAALLVGLKWWAWQSSGSVSLLASLLDSALDMAASLLNFLAVLYALRPADADHRFGHSKAEDMAGLAQSLIIGSSALFLLHEAISRLQSPVELTHSPLAIGVMIASLGITLLLVGFQRYAIRHTASIAVRADQAHYTMDIVSNLGVLAVLFLTPHLGWLWLDGVFALLCGLYFIYGAGKIGYEAFQRLMDQEFSDEERDRIKEITLSHPKVLGLHDLRTRQAGVRQFIQFHLELDKHQTLESAHAITVEIENLLHAEYPKAEIFIHQDPR